MVKGIKITENSRRYPIPIDTQAEDNTFRKNVTRTIYLFISLYTIEFEKKPSQKIKIVL